MNNRAGALEEPAQGQTERVRIKCSWDNATSLLCDSVISTIQTHDTFQVFDVHHPELGSFEIILSCVFGGIIHGCVDPQTVRSVLGINFSDDELGELVAHRAGTGGRQLRVVQ